MKQNIQCSKASPPRISVRVILHKRSADLSNCLRNDVSVEYYCGKQKGNLLEAAFARKRMLTAETVEAHLPPDDLRYQAYLSQTM